MNKETLIIMNKNIGFINNFQIFPNIEFSVYFLYIYIFLSLLIISSFFWLSENMVSEYQKIWGFQHIVSLVPKKYWWYWTLIDKAFALDWGARWWCFLFNSWILSNPHRLNWSVVFQWIHRILPGYYTFFPTLNFLDNISSRQQNWTLCMTDSRGKKY